MEDIKELIRKDIREVYRVTIGLASGRRIVVHYEDSDKAMSVLTQVNNCDLRRSNSLRLQGEDDQLIQIHPGMTEYCIKEKVQVGMMINPTPMGVFRIE